MEGNAFCGIFAASSARHLYLNAVPPPSFPLPIKRKNLDTFTFMRFARDFPIGPQLLPLLLSSRFSPRVYFYHKSLSPSRRMSRFTSAELAKITWQHLRKLWSFKPPHWCELEKKTPNSKHLNCFGHLVIWRIPDSLKPTKLRRDSSWHTCDGISLPHVLLFHPWVPPSRCW